MLKNSKSQMGFTLIELLIVIVIIGILAGVLLTVLNPVQQQNRARDASLRSTMNKMALATKAIIASSSTGNIPTNAEFFASLSNVNQTEANTCRTLLTAPCFVTVTGINLPTDCSANNGYNGTGAGVCKVNYWTSTVAGQPQHFRLAVKSFANPRGIFLYMYEQTTGASTTDEGFFFCPNVAANPFTVAAPYTSVAALRASPATCTAL